MEILRKAFFHNVPKNCSLEIKNQYRKPLSVTAWTYSRENNLKHIFREQFCHRCYPLVRFWKPVGPINSGCLGITSGHFHFLIACVAGEYYFDGRCRKCPKNTYSHDGNLTQCVKCPQFYATNNTGSTSVHDCKCMYIFCSHWNLAQMVLVDPWPFHLEQGA